jgi:hypothetical protein
MDIAFEDLKKGINYEIHVAKHSLLQILNAQWFSRSTDFKFSYESRIYKKRQFVIFLEVVEHVSIENVMSKKDNYEKN